MRRPASWRRFRRSLKEDTVRESDRFRRGGAEAGGAYGGRGFGGSGGSRGNFGSRTAAAGNAPGGGGSASFGSGSSASAVPGAGRVVVTTGGAQRTTGGAGAAAEAGGFKAGDKVAHGKWGTGTIVSVKGSGNDTEPADCLPGAGRR